MNITTTARITHHWETFPFPRTHGSPSSMRRPPVAHRFSDIVTNPAVSIKPLQTSHPSFAALPLNKPWPALPGKPRQTSHCCTQLNVSSFDFRGMIT
jgi:hypothetical protein